MITMHDEPPPGPPIRAICQLAERTRETCKGLTFHKTLVRVTATNFLYKKLILAIKSNFLNVHIIYLADYLIISDSLW
jgi:hypothetical protein